MAAIYLADDEQTVWAEWYRALAERAFPPRVWLPCDLWSIDVDLTNVADLSDRDRLSAAGLQPPSPGRHGWARYQDAGERLFTQGCRGIIAPSAARPEGCVLCVFCPTGVPEGLHAPSPPRRVDEPPVPPRGLRT